MTLPATWLFSQNLRRSVSMATLRGVRAAEYRSKVVRSGAAIGARLFSPALQKRPMSDVGDAQACIRSALRRRRRTLGLTQEAAAAILGMSRLITGSRPAGGTFISPSSQRFAPPSIAISVNSYKTGSSPTRLPTPQRRSSARLRDKFEHSAKRPIEAQAVPNLLPLHFRSAPSRAPVAKWSIACVTINDL